MTEDYLFTQIRSYLDRSKKDKPSGQIIITLDISNGGITRGRIQQEIVLQPPPAPDRRGTFQLPP